MNYDLLAIQLPRSIRNNLSFWYILERKMKVKYFCDCKEVVKQISGGWISMSHKLCVDCGKYTVVEIIEESGENNGSRIKYDS
jgi:hypothetical protein